MFCNKFIAKMILIYTISPNEMASQKWQQLGHKLIEKAMKGESFRNQCIENPVAANEA